MKSNQINIAGGAAACLLDCMLAHCSGTLPVLSVPALRVFWAAGTAYCCLYCLFLSTLLLVERQLS